MSKKCGVGGDDTYNGKQRNDSTPFRFCLEHVYDCEYGNKERRNDPDDSDTLHIQYFRGNDYEQRDPYCIDAQELKKYGDRFFYDSRDDDEC